MFYLGIDVSKAKLDCMLLESSSQKKKSKVVPNSAAGFKQLLDWLAKQGAADVHVVMEPTGVYHENCALALTDAGLRLSLVNPARIRDYAKATGFKNKTDKMDSSVLAQFGWKENPAVWEPPSQEARTLKALLVRRDAVAEDVQREKNRKEKAESTSTPNLIMRSIDDAIMFLEAELAKLEAMIDDHIGGNPDLKETRRLLETIPGVGPRVSSHITSLFAAKKFERAENLSSYLGLAPVFKESGTSVKGKPQMSKEGPSHLRKLLYMPAVSATRCNPQVKAMYERLLARGKPKMSAIGAAMRKLAHLCFGVVQSGKPYDRNFAHVAA
jgi:transposase